MSRSDRKFASPTKIKEEAQPPAEISERNLWPETQRHSSSHGGHSPKWTDWDASDVKSKDRSGWPSWQFSQGDRDMQKDDTMSRDVRKVSNSPTFDEQGFEEYSHSSDNCQNLSYRGRGRDRKRSRSRDRGRIRSPRRDENRGRGRDRNRSWERGRSRSRSRSPFRDLRHASYELTEKRNGPRMTSKPCKDFTSGKCRRGGQCGFSHHGNLNYRDGGSSENELTERWRSRADHGGALRFGNNKWAADSPRDSISDGYRKYHEEDESLRDSRKDTLCCMDFLKGKCRRGASCRYPHHNASGGNYDTENKKVFYDQAVKRVTNKSGKYPCKYFTMGKCHRNDCRFSHDGPAAGTLDGRSRDDKGGHNLDDKNESWNGPKWDDDAAFPDTAKVTVREEDMRKSWKGPTWDDVAGFADEPKATGWGDSTLKTTNFHDPAAADNCTVDKWGHSVEDESKVKGSLGGNEKVADRGEFLSHIPETANAKGWGEDKKISWNDPQCDALKSPSDRSQPTGWGDGSFKNNNYHGPMAADKQNDDKWGPSSENERKERGGPGWNVIAADGVKVLASNQRNGRNGRSHDDRWGYDLDYKKKSRSGSSDAIVGFPYTAKATGYGEDKKKSWNGPTWDDVVDSLDRPETTRWGGTSIGNTDSHDSTAIEKPFPDTAKVTVREEDMRKSWKGPTWDDVAGFADEPKATGWGDSTQKTTNFHDPAAADNCTDDKWGYSVEDESKVKGSLGGNEKVADRGEFLSHIPETANAKGWGEDKKISWNDPQCDALKSPSDRSQPTGWGDSSFKNNNYHDPMAADKQNDDKWGPSSENERKERGGPGWNEMAADGVKVLTSNQHNGRNGRSRDDRRGYDLDYKKKSRRGSRDAFAGFPYTAKATGYGEDKKKSWNGPTWDDVVDSLDRPETTGWGGTSIGNTDSHDSTAIEKPFPDTAKVTVREEDMRKSWKGPTWDDAAGFADEPKPTGWGDSTQKTINFHDPAAADNCADDKWGHSVEDESKVKGSLGGNEKVADRGEFLSHIPETANAKGWGEDKKISWNDPQCDALKSPSDRSQPTGWGDRSFKDNNYRDPITADKQNDDKWGPSSENERKERGGPGWNEMAADGVKVLTSNQHNGRIGRSRDDRQGYDLDYKKKSRSGQRDAIAGFPYTAKATGYGEDKKKSWNGPTWDDVVDSLDRPETTGWGGTSIGNTDSHDSTAIENPSNDRWGRSLEDERKARGGLGRKSRNEKAAEGVKFLTPNRQNGGNRMSHDERWDYNLDDKNKSQTGSRDVGAGFPDTVKVKGQEEDEKKSWNGPTRDDVEDSLDRAEATGWGGGSFGNTDSHDPAAAEKQSDYNMGHSLAKKRKAMSGPGWTEKVSGRDDFLPSHRKEGSNGADKGITELIDSKMLIYGEEHQNNVQGSELQTLGGISTNFHEQNIIQYTSARQLDNSSMQPEIPEISYIQPHQIQGVDNSMAITASSDVVNQLQLSENDTHSIKVLGDSLGSPPPSSLSGTDQSCQKLSLKPSNFLNIDLNKSVQHKVSTLDSQNQAQIHCKEVVTTPEMTEFRVPQISQIGRQNPPNTTGLVHPNSSKVRESGGLEVEEYQESSMLKQEDSVAKPEVNVSNEIVTEDNRKNAEGEKRKQEQENIHLGGVDANCKVEESNSSQDEKAMRLFKIALVELVKEILNPTWKQGKMSKEVYKTIVKKAVDKVTSTIHGVQIPKTQEHIDHYISFSKLKISSLVEAYVEKFQKN